MVFYTGGIHFGNTPSFENDFENKSCSHIVSRPLIKKYHLRHKQKQLLLESETFSIHVLAPQIGARFVTDVDLQSEIIIFESILKLLK